MAQDRQQVTVDGQAVLRPDFNLPFQEAALTEDLVLQELIHLPGLLGGAVSKAILPYNTGSNTALVTPNGASGSVFLNPFRVIVGPRTAVSATPGSALLAWNDARSRVYAVTADNATLGGPVAFAANSSGNPRWDIVYAALAVDQNTATVNRNVRSPGSAATAPPVATPVVLTLTQTVTIGVQPGTPAASPALPALPADTVTATGTFYVPIAAVLIPNGFGATTTILTEWIAMQAPVVPITTALGGIDSRPPSAFTTGLSSTALGAWGSSSTRPGQALPCTRQGERRMKFGFDATTASPLLGDTAVLDNLIDWRKREITVTCRCNPGATQFASQPGATSGAVPQAAAAQVSYSREGQSFLDDSAAVLGVSSRTAGVAFFANNAAFSPIAAGSNAIGLYVPLSGGNAGALCVYYLGTPGQLFRFSVEASAPYDNA